MFGCVARETYASVVSRAFRWAGWAAWSARKEQPHAARFWIALHARIEEEAVDDELPAPLEEVEQGHGAARTLEAVLLLHGHPRHPAPRCGQRVAGAGQLLLLDQQFLTGCLPCLRRNDLRHLHCEFPPSGTRRLLLVHLHGSEETETHRRETTLDGVIFNRSGRFDELVRTQLDLFAEDEAELLEEAQEADEAQTRADRDEAEASSATTSSSSTRSGTGCSTSARRTRPRSTTTWRTSIAPPSAARPPSGFLAITSLLTLGRVAEPLEAVEDRGRGRTRTRPRAPRPAPRAA